MAPPLSPLAAALRAITAGCALVLLASLPAAESGGLGSTLSVEQQAAAGLPRLSPAERIALDQLLAGDLALVRGGEVEELAGTFVSRRTEAEVKSAGLDRLTPDELTKLNEIASAALAIHPRPKERHRIKDSDVFSEAPKPEVHGSISLTYGVGAGGRNFHGSSFEVDYFDPAHGFSLSVGVSSFSGKGFCGYYPGGYLGSPFYALAPGYLDASYHGPFRDDSWTGDGESLRAPYAQDWSGRAFRRY